MDGVEVRSIGKIIGDIGLLRSDTTSAELVDIRPAEDFVATLVLDGIRIRSWPCFGNVEQPLSSWTSREEWSG